MFSQMDMKLFIFQFGDDLIFAEDASQNVIFFALS